MSAGPSSAAAPPRTGAGDLVAAACLGALVVATAAAGTLGNGSPVLVAVPSLAAAGLYALVRAPLRVSVTALVLVSLSVDDSGNAEGVWHTPLAAVGDLLFSNLDKVARIPGLKLNGMEILILLLVAIAVHRKATGNPVDARGQVQLAAVSRDTGLVFLAGIGLATAVGLARGGSPDVAIYQTRPFLTMAVLFFLFEAAFRGPADHALLGRVLVLAASVKAAIAVWVRYKVAAWMGEDLEFATSHADSILFVSALVVLVVAWMERPDRKRLLDCALFMPLILWGIEANARRVAWVELVLALAAIYFASAWHPWKRALTRTAIVAAPILLLYGAAGWDSTSPTFAPVKSLRSLLDAKIDRSTWNRDVESWNLATSLAQTRLLGRGFGHEYTEFIKGDDLSRRFKQYRALPHNQVLGLVLFAGPIGFAALWAPFVVGIYLALRAYRAAAAPRDRAAALASVGAFVVIFVQAFGDMGMLSNQSRVVTALAIVVSGKLAVATGAWPRRPLRDLEAAGQVPRSWSPPSQVR